MSLRSLQHVKSNRIEIKKGVPSPNEGNNGELRLGITAKGIFLYVKYGNRWYQLGDAAISSGGQFSAQGVASVGAGTLATSIDRGNQSLKMGGNVVLSGNTISDTGSNKGIKFDDSATARVDVATTKVGTNGYLSLTDNEIDVSSGDLTLDITGNIITDVAGGDFTIQDSTELGKPDLYIKSTSNDAVGGSLTFIKDKGAAGADDQYCGSILFIGEDADQNAQTYGYMHGRIDVAAGGEESGQIELGVANHDGGIANGLVLSGGSADDEIDVTIGLGTTSMTTIAGDLDIDGDVISSAGNLTLDIGGALALDAGNGRYLASNAGTEFSAANSSYAGMMLGYTYIRNTDAVAGDDTIALTTSLDALQTVNGTDVKVRFTVPPSGNVEIELSCMVYASSREFTFSLSTGGAGSYSALGAEHEYDGAGIKPDETDYIVANPKWVVTGLTPGTDTTYYIAAKISSTPGSIYHGTTRTGLYTQPIIVKATALPLSTSSQMLTGT